MAEKDESKKESQEAPKKVIEINIGVIAAAVAALVLMPVVTYFIVIKAVDIRSKDVDVAAKPQPVNVDLEPIVVNIAETKGTRFLKAKITLALENPMVAEEVALKKAQIIDILINLCSSRSLDELEQNMGRERLKKDIITRLNPLLDHGRVLNVFFSEFVIQ